MTRGFMEDADDDITHLHGGWLRKLVNTYPLRENAGRHFPFIKIDSIVLRYYAPLPCPHPSLRLWGTDPSERRETVVEEDTSGDGYGGWWREAMKREPSIFAFLLLEPGINSGLWKASSSLPARSSLYTPLRFPRSRGGAALLSPFSSTKKFDLAIHDGGEFENGRCSADRRAPII